EFRSKFCSFCRNNEFDYNTGLKCGLEVEPYIHNNTCTSYLPNLELVERTSFNKQREEKKNSFRSKIESFKNTLLIGIVIMVSLYGVVNWATLELDNRYTIAQVRVINQTSFDESLIIGGYKCEFEYVFTANGKRYSNQKTLGKSRGSRLPEPIWPKKFLIKYSPNNPDLNEVLPRIDVTNITFYDIPTNGINPDSLDNFLANFAKD
ncbi:MAG: hypothetical protein RIA69_01120, partial [Cyclobacteriaceae bacterium]